MQQSVGASCAQLLLQSEPASLHVQTVLSLCVGMSTGELFWKPGLSDTFISWSRHFLIPSRCDPVQFALGGPSAEGCDCTISRVPSNPSCSMLLCDKWLREPLSCLAQPATEQRMTQLRKGNISLTHQVYKHEECRKAVQSTIKLHQKTPEDHSRGEENRVSI